LLYPGNDPELKAEKILIVGPNITFIKYIEKVVPGLGDSQVQHQDLSNLGPKVKVSRIENEEIAKIKGDPRMKTLLTQALKDRLRIPQENFIYSVPNSERQIELSAEGLLAKLEEFRSANLNYSSARYSLKIWLLNSINEILRQEYENQKSGTTRGIPFIRESDVESLTERIWPSITPNAFLRDFYGSQGRILTAASSLDFSVKEILLLERRASESIAQEEWSLGDLALLDFLDFKISGTVENFDYIIVDEAQDMTPMQLDSIRRRSTTGDILLLGDMAQATGVWLYSKWQEIAELLSMPISRFDELAYGYRVPKQIFDLAANVLSYIDPALKSPTLVRNFPDSPRMNVFSGRDQLLHALISDLQVSDFSKGLTGIITTDELCLWLSEALTKAKISFTPAATQPIATGLNLVPISKQKGLEFDSVILVEPQDIIDIPLVGLRHLYVALSRALRKLQIFTTERIPHEIKDKSSLPNTTQREKLLVEHRTTPQSILEEISGYLAVKGMGFADLVDLINSQGQKDG
jgi:DNA helicase IV